MIFRWQFPRIKSFVFVSKVQLYNEKQRNYPLNVFVYVLTKQKMDHEPNRSA
jgi:hypothetical protein